MRSPHLRTPALAVALSIATATPAAAQIAPAAPPTQGVVQTGAWAVPLGAPVAVAQTPAPEDLDADGFDNSPALSAPAPAADPAFLAPETVIGDPGLADPYVTNSPVNPSGSYPAGSFAGPAYSGGSALSPAYGCDTCPGGTTAGYGPTFQTPTAPAYPSTVYQGFAGNGRRSGLTTGFAFVFLRPRFESNDAFVTTQSLPGPVTQTKNVELAHELGFGWRVWVETVGNDDFGFRVAYFDFDEPANAQVRAIPAGVRVTGPALPTATGNAGFDSTALGADGVGAVGELSIYALDFEFVRRHRRDRWLFNVGGGLRHAAFEQDYASVLTSGNAVVASSSASRRFDGIGPTIFGEVRRPVGMSGLSLLAGLRGSLLYGEHKDGFTTFSQGQPIEVAGFNNDDIIPVGELQLGGEWSFWLTPVSVLSVQVAWEAQVWEGAGSNVAREGDLGLSGFNVALGLEW